ncbi:extracellular solute-binding protein [uncultured Brachyspira sp.]|uniref:extracellular solute-binding protein n=1 Tax=uncultured Brachyspira sp. TaxID=221953 RepID=UPI0026301214|nr:extracellular solute-binding protein [uncultured Brachyspira sp.]
MKKVIISLIIITLLSCSKKASDENTIKVWHVQNVGEQVLIKERAGERFKKENPGYDVEIVALKDNAYKTQIQIALGANTPPDVFFTWTGGGMIDYIKAGKIIDLTPYIAKYDLSNRLVPASLLQASYEGKIYALPVDSTTIAMVFYNKKLFEENGWTVPTTLRELESLCDKILAKGIKPFALANKTKWPASIYYMYLVQRIGGNKVFYDAANRVNGGSFENPAFIEAGKKLVEWVDKGYFNDGFNGLDNDSGQSTILFYTGKSAMVIAGSFLVGTIASENPEFLNQVDAFLFPAIEGGKGDPRELVGTIGENFYCISSTSKHPDQAFELMTKFIDDQSVEELTKIAKLPPVKGASIDSPIFNKIVAAIEEAPDVQLFYDQYLPRELAEVHKDTLQAMMGKTITPEEACKQLEAKALELLGPSSK